MITAAPEIGDMTSLIPELKSRGILFSIGHTEATYEEAAAAVAAGATMITHLFNAMRPLHHRNPGPFGVLGAPASAPLPSSSASSVSSGSSVAEKDGVKRPYFGIIADGIHLHPTSIKIAYSSHPSGCILVTDAMPLIGMPDGTYPYSNGDRIVKAGNLLTLEGTDKIAGSVIDLIGCVNNFLEWSGVTIAEALGCVTTTPARMLGLEDTKGTLDEGADADLCIFSEENGRLVVEQVWKFGVSVFDKDDGVVIDE
jgi:N-acetylglucosamine-6-phosphate deacetylase